MTGNPHGRLNWSVDSRTDGIDFVWKLRESTVLSLPFSEGREKVATHGTTHGAGVRWELHIVKKILRLQEQQKESGRMTKPQRIRSIEHYVRGLVLRSNSKEKKKNSLSRMKLCRTVAKRQNSNGISAVFWNFM